MIIVRELESIKDLEEQTDPDPIGYLRKVGLKLDTMPGPSTSGYEKVTYPGHGFAEGRDSKRPWRVGPR
jgi:hypothetical protein